MKTRLLKLCTGAILLSSIGMDAQDGTFNIGGGDNLWNNNANWSVVDYTTVTGTATISANATLNVDHSVEKLKSGSADVTLSGSNIITLSGAQSPFIQANNDGAFVIDVPVISNIVNKNIDTKYETNNKLVFGENGSLQLNETAKIRNYSVNPVEFNGDL